MSSEQDVASTQSFHRDLENARVLIEDLPWRDNPQKYRKTAETILRRILTFDPQNQTAKLLLAKAEVPAPEPAPARSAQPDRPFVQARAAQPAQPAHPVPPKVQAAPAVAVAPSPRPAPPAPVAAQAPPRRSQQDLSFVVPTTPRDPKKKYGEKPARRPPWGLLGVAAIGAGGGLLLLLVHPTTSTSQYVPQAATAAPLPVQVSEPVTAHKVAPVAEPAVVTEPATAEVAAPAAEPVPASPAAPARPSMVVKSELPRVAPIQTGTLAVSSPTTVDIYMGDQLVGSAPTTLVLPAGNQTVEYRHQDMRKTVTHVIKANETITATVTFDVPLQINARPWAQVSIDGPQRRSLGQTPLSDVRVPIGSLLIFENPNFPGKSYRVTGKETEIRMTFP